MGIITTVNYYLSCRPGAAGCGNMVLERMSVCKPTIRLFCKVPLLKEMHMIRCSGPRMHSGDLLLINVLNRVYL